MDGRERRLLDLAFEVMRADDLAEFRTVVTHGVGAVVGADLVGYTEVSPARGYAYGLTDHPVGLDHETLTITFARLAHQHPLITHPSSRARTISDHLTARAYHSLELYHDFYRLLGAEDQLAIGLAKADGLVIGVALNRSTTARR
jgi:hypothetical protein